MKIKRWLPITDNRQPITYRRAFTLIEILVVVAIIGILATIVIINVTGAKAKSRDTKRMADLNTLQKAIEMHGYQTGAFVGTDGVIETRDLGDSSNQSLAEVILAGGYIDQIPCDPLGCKGSQSPPPYTGYAYLRKDSTTETGGMVPITCLSALQTANPNSLRYNIEHFSLYAHMEVSGDGNTSTFDAFDNCIRTMPTLYATSPPAWEANYSTGN